MWYLYLRRDQHYLRSYRTHNLWLDSYHRKLRTPKINSFHVAVLRRMSKSVSGVSSPNSPSSLLHTFHSTFLVSVPVPNLSFRFA